MKTIVYIAGPLYTPHERSYIEEIAQKLEKLGIITFVPHRDAGLCPPGEESTEFYFKKDIEYIDKSSIIIAILNGSDVDSGTAFEMGYGFAKGKLIIGLLDDTRIANPKQQINLMIYNSCYNIFNNIDTLINYIKDWGESNGY